MKNINIYIVSLLIIVFSTTSFLAYQQIFAYKYLSDMPGHILFTYQYVYNIDKLFYLPHPIWHYSVAIISSITTISIEYAAIIVSAGLVTFWTYLVYYYTNTRLNNINKKSAFVIRRL